jgi:protein O-GlcNAc transferase
VADRRSYGEALKQYEAGCLPEAAAICEKVLRRSPGDAHIRALLGDVLQRQGRLDEAIAAYEHALRTDRRLHAAWYGSGCAWLTKQIYATALDCFERAAAIAPDDAASQHNVGTALFKLGFADEALQRFRRSLTLRDSFLPRTAIAVSIPGSPDADHTSVLAARRDWTDRHLPRAELKNGSQRTGAERLRIGYLSSFFESRNWMKPVWGLINHHDRHGFDIHLFADCAEAECAGYERHERDTFHDISKLSNQQAAARIEQAELDILIDLNGYSRITRLAVPAQRPAPIQVAWFNMYATSGMTCFDYLIGDEHVISADEEQFYTEKIVRVPGCYLTFDVRYRVPDVSDAPSGKAGHITFGCLASQYKITPAVVEVWSRILAGSPSSRLFVKNTALGEKANRTHLAGRFRQHGIGEDRLEFDGPAEHFDFLAAYSRIDIALDTFPYNGGTTTSEAIWQGVPVLTFRGDRWASRQSTSILRTGGLDAFVADNVNDYVERAVRLADDPETPARLTELRRGMRERLAGSPLCDTAGFARNMEDIYRQFAQMGKQS